MKCDIQNTKISNHHENIFDRFINQTALYTVCATSKIIGSIEYHLHTIVVNNISVIWTCNVPYANLMSYYVDFVTFVTDEQ